MTVIHVMLPRKSSVMCVCALGGGGGGVIIIIVVVVIIIIAATMKHTSADIGLYSTYTPVCNRGCVVLRTS